MLPPKPAGCESHRGVNGGRSCLGLPVRELQRGLRVRTPDWGLGDQTRLGLASAHKMPHRHCGPLQDGHPVSCGAHQRPNTMLLERKSSLWRLVITVPCLSPPGRPALTSASQVDGGPRVLPQLCLAPRHMIPQSPLGAQSLRRPMGKLRPRHRVTPRRRGPA